MALDENVRVKIDGVTKRKLEWIAKRDSRSVGAVIRLYIHQGLREAQNV